MVSSLPSLVNRQGPSKGRCWSWLSVERASGDLKDEGRTGQVAAGGNRNGGSIQGLGSPEQPPSLEGLLPFLPQGYRVQKTAHSSTRAHSEGEKLAPPHS